MVLLLSTLPTFFDNNLLSLAYIECRISCYEEERYLKMHITNIITKSKGDRFELRIYKEVYSRPVMAVLVTSRSISGFKTNC